VPAQIFEPQVGRRYRVHVDGDVIVARVVGWDLETVDVAVIERPCHASAYPKQIHLTRADVRFEEWL